MDVLLEKKVKCRKSHRCIWCGETVEVGKIVPFRKYVFDGAIQNEHFHPECYEAMPNYDDRDDDGFDAYMFKRGTGDPA